MLGIPVAPLLNHPQMVSARRSVDRNPVSSQQQTIHSEVCGHTRTSETPAGKQVTLLGIHAPQIQDDLRIGNVWMIAPRPPGRHVPFHMIEPALGRLSSASPQVSTRSKSAAKGIEDHSYPRCAIAPPTASLSPTRRQTDNPSRPAAGTCLDRCPRILPSQEYAALLVSLLDRTAPRSHSLPYRSAERQNRRECSPARTDRAR